MFWIIFTAVDLYVGLVIIDLLARSQSLTPGQQRRAAIAKKLIWAGLAGLAVALAVKLVRR